VSEENHHPEHPADAGWPMPPPEMRRLLQPVPVWNSSPSDDAEPDGD
jgi:hypothetical protein